MREKHETTSGWVMQLQDFSVHDGDGIRTTVFLSGCPLRCGWCANPEGWTTGGKLAYFADKCTGCGTCGQVCPEGYFPAAPDFQNEGCGACGICAARCPQGALQVFGEKMTVEEAVRRIQRDSLFYGFSGGGVTFSGGEATFQKEYLRCLARELYDRGISLWLETCGFFSFEEQRDVLMKMDHIFYDIKHMEDAVHRRMTGQSNRLILENAKAVYRLGIPMTVRIPAIPGVNMDPGNLAATAAFLGKFMPEADLELLPYHSYGAGKFKALRLSGGREFAVPGRGELERAKGLLEGLGVKLVEYR